MANHLKMATIHAILTLYGQGWSKRRIARELGLDRETVARHIALAGLNPVTGAANPPLGAPGGSGGVEGSKPATNPPLGAAGAGEEVEGSKPATDPSNPPHGAGDGARPGPASASEPFRAIILEKFGQGLSARRIYQDLAGEPDAPSYESVKRFIRLRKQTAVLPFRRMEVEPGQESQVDFGTGAPVGGAAGTRRKTHVFRIVLSCSRKAYSEAVYRQTTEDFLACLENAFWAFGGVTRTVIIDNLRAAVVHPDWFDPEVNPRVAAFCAHYGTVILPAKPYMPRHKGKVERGIGYVKNNGLKGREFTSLAAENLHLREWEKGVADTRLHGTTRQHVGKVFEQVERPALLPLPTERFPFFHEALRMVARDGHVAVGKAYYSVPPEYVGRQVWVRWDAHLVRVFNHRREQIAAHARQEPGRFSTLPAHIHVHKTSAVEKGAAWLLQQASLLGPPVARWSQEMLQARGIAGVRVLVGLLALAKRQPGADLATACQVASSHQAYRLRAIRELLHDGAGSVGEQEDFEFTQAHPLIRGLGEYDALVREAFRGLEPALAAEGS